MKERIADILNMAIVLMVLIGFAVINFFINGGPELVAALNI